MMQINPLTPLPPPALHTTFPSHPVIQPPLPYTVGPISENLNPDVPEFVPVVQPTSNGTVDTDVDECVEACEESLSLNTDSTTNSPPTLENRLHPRQENGDTKSRQTTTDLSTIEANHTHNEGNFMSY